MRCTRRIGVRRVLGRVGPRRPALLPMFVKLFMLAGLATGCASSGAGGSAPTGTYAIAIHGGAGSLDRDDPIAMPVRESLRRALAYGRDILARGGSSLDAVEQVVRILEDDELFNAGKGAVFTHDGGHELDAAIMDGRTHACGAVTGVRTVKNPIALARLVMERSSHVFFAAAGAEQFATELGVERVDPTYFDVERRREQWRRRHEENLRRAAGARGTVGAVALDQHGNLASATSTGGLTDKRFGRIGDTPVIGAGTYASNRSCAVSCTGTGEEFIRHCVAHSIASLMEHAGLSARQAARRVVHEVLQPDDGGVIVVSRSGEIALVFNTAGMARASADSTGRFEIALWDEADGGGEGE